jgi:hypothetical protein
MSVTDKIRRLSEMSFEELRFRAAQQWRVQRERIGLAVNGRRSTAEVGWWNPARVTDGELRAAIEKGQREKVATRLPAYFSTRKHPRFYFGAEEQEMIRAAYARWLPERVAEIRAEADAYVEHRFQIFAYPEVSVGRSIPWRKDWIHGRETNLAHWSRIPYLDFARAGDSKIVWEPNRHQHFFTLGQAFLLTGSETYAEECRAQMLDWIEQNPPHRGINWASSLELGFRIWSWLWAMNLFQGSTMFDGRTIAALLSSLAVQARQIRENLSVYFSPNTHLLGEGFALFCTGLLLPELRGAEDWYSTGRRILEEEMTRQVRADGSHLEQSSYYHRYATDFFLCAALLAERNGIAFPAGYRTRLEKMCEFILFTQLPGGLHPMTGDADGGRLLALTPNRSPAGPNDQRATLSTAAVYFQRGDFLRAAGGLREETLWLLGEEWCRWQERPAGKWPEETSRTFGEAGLVVQRDAWGESGRVLLFDAGPQGMGACAHGHADALQVMVSADGVDWLVDPGTFVYTSSYGWRHFFRSTRAHSTVVVDGRDQAEPVDFFKWKNIPEPRLELSAHAPRLDVALGGHDGYRRLEQPVTHRRCTIFVKPEYWLLLDEFSGSGRHELEFNFHFAPGIKVRCEDGAWVAAQGERRFVVITPPAVELSVVSGEENPAQGWYSRDYGHRQSAPVLVAAAKAEMPGQYAWILGPFSKPWPRLRRLAGPGLRAGVDWGGHRDLVAVAGQELQVSDAELWTDAQVCFLRLGTDGRPLRFVLVNGCCAATGGKPLLRVDSLLDMLDVARSGELLDVYMRPARRLLLYAPGASAARVNGAESPVLRHGDWIEIPGER